MNLEEFYRQAKSLRRYTPTVTAATGSVTDLDIKQADFMVAGQLVLVMLSITFTLSANPISVKITTPTPIRTLGVGVGIAFIPVMFSGEVNIGGGGYATIGDLTAKNVSILRSDNSNWSAGTLRAVKGGLIYQNGE